MERNHNLKNIYKATFILNHIFYSAWIGPKYANIFLTMPKYLRMIMNWLVFFFCVLVMNLVLKFVDRESSDWNTTDIIILAAILVICIQLFRIL